MKRLISSMVVSALALVGGAVVGGAPAYAATTPTLVLSERSAVFGMGPVFITATASTAGNVKFSEAGIVIKGCEAVATTTVSPFIAKCLWLPAAGGPTILLGTLTPTDAVNFTAVDSAPFTAKVGVPVQGVISPIHIYVDTVLGSGAVGPLASRTGITCAITSEYLVGQMIVFRVYANNAAQGGAPMDFSNTAKAYIEIAGVKDPIQMSYGNHSGGAFWVGVLRTGTAAGLYNKLGIIDYKVTMIAKDQDTMKVLTTKLVRKTLNGVRVIENGKQVFERVPSYRTVSVSPALKGAVGTWKSNFVPSSLLTLFAAPTTP